MKRVLRTAWWCVKCLLIGVICLELLSFLTITISDFIFYGQAGDASRAVYDSYALFLQNTRPRGTPPGSVAQAGKKNVTLWLFGGSTMRGATGSDEKTIPSFLSQYLNSGKSNVRYIVKNYGMDSFNSLLETKYLQKLLIETDKPPDIIAFYDGAEDSRSFAEYRSPNAHYGYRRAQALIQNSCKSWCAVLAPLTTAIDSSFTKQLCSRVNLFFIPIEKDSPALRKMVRATAKRYDHVDKMADCYGAEFILFWQPMLWVQDCPVPESVKEQEKKPIVQRDLFATMRENLAMPYVALGEKLRHKRYFVSMRNVLCGAKTSAYQPDGVRLTDQGRKIVAIRMGRILAKRLEE